MTPEDSFNLEHLIKTPTCFKGSPSYIDLIITNRKTYFKKVEILETQILDFHKLTAVISKSQISKAPSKRKLYRDNKEFVENSFNNDLKTKLDSVKILDCSSFEDIFIYVLNTHAPVKAKTIRANNQEFLTKALWKEIMTRSRRKSFCELFNNYFINITDTLKLKKTHRSISL